MRKRNAAAITSLAIAALMVGCGVDDVAGSPKLAGPSFQSFARSEWSEPVHLDPPVNSSARELGAELSPDGLSIYFGSDRQQGSLGDVDIWVSHRDCHECPWSTAVDLGPNVNSAQSDGGPTLSPDGHLLFFSSNRTPGTLGGDDLWVSWRDDVHDDLAWEPAINLGPEVNSTDHETGPAFDPALHAEGGSLVFVRGAGTASDIWEVLVTRRGEALGPALPVSALNSSAAEGEPSIRGDGREIVFHSGRAGGGQLDIWVSTRQTPHGEWSVPEKLGSTINTPGADLTPFLSRDGRTLLWSAGMTARPSLGFQDIWMSTRTPSGHDPE